MALQFSNIPVGNTGITQSTSYVKIVTANADKIKNVVSIHVLYYKDSDAANNNLDCIKHELFQFEPTNILGDLFAQGYVYLKTLDCFASALDV